MAANQRAKGQPNLDIDAATGVVNSTDLRTRYKELVTQLRDTERPMLVVVDGKPSAVMLAPQLFEQIKTLLANGSHDEVVILDKVQREHNRAVAEGTHQPSNNSAWTTMHSDQRGG